MDTMSVTFGLNLMKTGLVVTSFTARVTFAADSGDVPKAIPPLWTLGHETFTSMISTCGSASMRRQHSAYSSVEKPLMLAIIGLWKRLRSRGNSSAITASMPGFCNPTEFTIPLRHSAIRGVGLPNRGSRVVPLNEIEPSISRSYSSANSAPNPKVPLAGIIGLSSRTVPRVTERSVILFYL